MNRSTKEKTQSSISSVRIKEIDVKQHGSTSLLTPKKSNMIISNQSSQSDNKQLKLNKKDLFRNKTFNNISYTPSHKPIGAKSLQSPFGGNVHGVVPASKSISNSVKNTTAKQINYMSSLPSKKLRPPLFVIQEKKIENQLTTNANNGSNTKEDKNITQVTAQNNISSSSKIIQMNKISFQSDTTKINKEDCINNKIINNRRNQNFHTVRTSTMPSSSYKPKRESFSQVKTGSRSLKKKNSWHDNNTKKIPKNNIQLNNTLNSLNKNIASSNPIRGKDNNNHHHQNKNGNNRKNYLSLNGSSDNFSFSNSKSKLKSPSNNVLRQLIPVVHFYTTEFVLLSYAKVLTQREVIELKLFDDSIYFIGRLPYRKLNKEYEDNDLVKSLIMEKSQQVILNNSNESKRSFIELPENRSTRNPMNKTEIEVGDSYDDEESDYNIIIGDHINYRYEILQLLGKGSFGEAVKCFDHKTNEYVCIKLVKSNQRFQSQAVIEIKLLEHIKANDKDHESNIVKYYSNFLFRNHKCIVFELLDMNLYEYIKARNYNGLELKKIKEYTIELLFTLLFLKRNKIIHCDLKPENILLLRNSKVNVKTIDFGSSCFDNEKMYCYIQSRFYRAPEIILDQGYGIEIDIWSLGCIIAELFTGVPIFPGEDERDQLNYIMEYLDVPSNDFIEISRKREMFFDGQFHPLRIPNSKGKIRTPKSKSFLSFLRGSDDLFQDFIRKCLKWYPEERLTPEEGLLHYWITKDMSSETLFLHKQKIKRIKNGNSKDEQANSNSDSSRISLKQKCIRKATNRSTTKKRINAQGSRFKAQTNTLNNNTKPLSTKHSTTGKFYVSLSLEENKNGNFLSNPPIPHNLNNIQEKSIDSKVNERGLTHKIIQQRFSFIDLDDIK